ncbi:heavy metal translocating P-type ATPase metal-binding domain-containing protein [Polyangium sp. y55x31]|uniref:heavy metal translocating P-type ATPase n=1 Tax=Polyangium sp. y55x31 TaxID=3042688 RepID=UPI002482FE6D|nr:heavy metal translocating P-type ATPase metal-binding domain-containing protein [Polyangium sp. y55x31]MDI1475944.1 heavy metal translocating P-type ATPase metal-binding domain-containing protein [Polyangium sp. y55x31]
MVPESRDGTCLHCGGPLPAAAEEGFCCAGCRFVHDLLREEHLERYYTLRGEKGEAVTAAAVGRDQKWLEPLEAELARAEGLHRLDLDVQGLSCAACVWLIEQLFRREKGGAGIVVNPALGRMRLTISRAFPLRRFVSRVESCGYLLGPKLKSEESPSNGLLLRMGIAVALAMNGMILAISVYAGLSEGPLHRLFLALSFGLATASVLVGGSYFGKTALAGLRRGVLHLDLPIALGILLAYASSTWGWLAHGLTTYFDTLTVFVALMLVGRFLQMRLIERNQKRLLQSDGAEGLYTRRLEGDTVVLRRAVEIRNGDTLVLASGDVVPVPAVILGQDDASFSLDWVNGESTPRVFPPGAIVPAGAFLSGARALTLRADTDFAAGSLVDLLRAAPGEGRDERGAAFWRTFARVYVAAVLVIAVLALGIGYFATHDARAALERVTAVLIVTCPCAFGIATPLAYELVGARLRRAGLFVRSGSFLDRAALVRTVVFDKTGTLTTGKLRIEDTAPAAVLSPEEKRLLKNLAARSTHPKSAALAQALGTDQFVAELDAREVTGRGVEAEYEGHLYRLGASAWIDPAAPEGDADVAFGVDGRVLAAFHTVEDLRPDAPAEIRALRAMGYDVGILSGDLDERALRVAAACGIAPEKTVGGKSAEAKAQWVREHDRGDLLFLGDGINDALVATEATVSGTPAIDRPFLAARTDFYFVTPGLAPVRLALASAQRLRRVLGITLSVALAYNVVTVGLSCAGFMTPLLCAVLMPLSSLSTILAVLILLGEKAEVAQPATCPLPPPEARLRTA